MKPSFERLENGYIQREREQLRLAAAELRGASRRINAAFKTDFCTTF
jgi:hypothetical protein